MDPDRAWTALVFSYVMAFLVVNVGTMIIETVAIRVTAPLRGLLSKPAWLQGILVLPITAAACFVGVYACIGLFKMYNAQVTLAMCLLPVAVTLIHDLLLFSREKGEVTTKLEMVAHVIGFPAALWFFLRDAPLY